MSKKKKIILSISTLLLIAIIGIGGFVGNYFYNLAINPFTSKDMIFGEDDDDSLEVEADANWLMNDSNYNDKYLTTDNNLKLHTYEIKQENETNKWAIVVHGYTSEGKLLSSKAKHLYNMGYNILIPDLRGHGTSQGDYIGMGWDDRLDIIDWINYIVDSNSNSEIALHGTSMGAATVLMVSGENLPSNLKAIIADCGYTSVYDEFKYQLKELFNLPAFPVLNVSDIVTHIRAGYCLNDASAINQVKKSKTPILYIHGDKDDFVPYYMMDELYNSTSSKKEKLTIKGGEHANSDLVNPQLYWSTIEEFLEKYIK